jgi:serine protease Do
MVAALIFNRADAQENPLAAAKEVEQALISVIEKAEKSIVSIARVPRDAEAAEAPRPRFEPFRERPDPTAPGFIPQDFGSGVVIARGRNGRDRFVLTAAHVVYGRRTFTPPQENPEAFLKDVRIFVRLASRHVVQAELTAADPRSDFAVLKLNLEAAGVPLEAAPPLPFGDASSAKKGQFVVALGNPYAIARDGSASVSTGIISNVSRRPWPPGGMAANPAEDDLTIHHYGTLLHVDTRLNLGTSGGALVNLDGELIGLTMSLAALEGYETSVGYAVPIDQDTRRVIESLMEGYEAEYGFLGVHPGDAGPELLRPFRHLTTQPSAARIRKVAGNSPAERAGLKDQDIVLAVDGKPVYSDVDLMREVGWLGPDADAELTVLRPGAGTLQAISCRLGKWPVYDDSLLVATRERFPAWRGLHVDYPTARHRYLPGNILGLFPRGVVVTKVVPESPAAKAGLSEAAFIVEIEGQRVDTPVEFHDEVRAFEGPVKLLLLNGNRVEVSAPGTPD